MVITPTIRFFRLSWILSLCASVLLFVNWSDYHNAPVFDLPKYRNTLRIWTIMVWINFAVQICMFSVAKLSFETRSRTKIIKNLGMFVVIICWLILIIFGPIMLTLPKPPSCNYLRPAKDCCPSDMNIEDTTNLSEWQKQYCDPTIDTTPYNYKILISMIPITLATLPIMLSYIVAMCFLICRCIAICIALCIDLTLVFCHALVYTVTYGYCMAGIPLQIITIPIIARMSDIENSKNIKKFGKACLIFCGFEITNDKEEEEEKSHTVVKKK